MKKYVLLVIVLMLSTVGIIMMNKKQDTNEVMKKTFENVNESLKILDQMTTEEKVYQMFMVRPEQLCEYEDEESIKVALETKPVGGVAFFGHNIYSPEQLTNYIQTLQNNSKIELFIAVDEEGGVVSRLENNPNFNMTQFPPMAYIESDEEAYNVGYTIGSEIAQYGFNMDFAPVADVNSNPDNLLIGERAFSSDPAVVASRIESCVKGFKDANVLSTLKHFPGHGDVSTDTHVEATYCYKTVDELKQCEWIPFESGIQEGADCVMIAHIIYPNVTSDGLPASLSYEMVTDYLKNELSFEGLCITDALEMEAISAYYSPQDSAVLAILAGEDIILIPYNLEEAVNGVLQAIDNGIISMERINTSVCKILEYKAYCLDSK